MLQLLLQITVVFYILQNNYRSLSSDKRPKFSDLMNQLDIPESDVLYFSEEDKKGKSETAFQLGTELRHGISLYKDLQVQYIQTQELTSNQDADSNSDYM